MYKKVYKKLNLVFENLLRIFEDVGILILGFVFWFICGVVYLVILGVSVF